MQLTICCGCCSLKTGTIIIGVLGIVFSVFFLIETFTVNIKWPLIFTTTVRPRERNDPKMQLTTCCGCCSLKTGTIIIGLLQFMLVVFMLIVIITWDIEWQLIINLDNMTAKIIFGIYYCIIILFCTLLIIGSIKKNAFMMLPWMVINMIIAVIFLVSVFYKAIMFINNDMVSAGLSSYFFGLVALMLHMYQWMVVYCHFQELRIGSRNCAKERVSIENPMVIDGGPACPRERSDPTSAISFT